MKNLYSKPNETELTIKKKTQITKPWFACLFIADYFVFEKKYMKNFLNAYY